jgi:hypothetical protein
MCTKLNRYRLLGNLSKGKGTTTFRRFFTVRAKVVALEFEDINFFHEALQAVGIRHGGIFLNRDNLLLVVIGGHNSSLVTSRIKSSSCSRKAAP